MPNFLTKYGCDCCDLEFLKYLTPSVYLSHIKVIEWLFGYVLLFISRLFYQTLFTFASTFYALIS